MVESTKLLFWYCSFCSLIATFGQDFLQLQFWEDHSFLLFPNGSKSELIEKIDIFPTKEKVVGVSETLEILIHHEGKENRARKRRQIFQADYYNFPLTSDLHASQNCHGIFLRWTNPQYPLSSTKPFTISEVSYYNIYRSKIYFTNVNGMTPYASGKEYYELRNLQTGWIDRDPVTNEQVWYAVTIVTEKGGEFKDVAPAKAKFIGAFGPPGKRISLTSGSIVGRTLYHSAIFNSDRNEYFIVYDVDTNFDGQPDRIYALRMSPNGAVVRNKILDITVTGLPGSQGHSSIAYNPISNEYAVFFQLTSPRLFDGKSAIAAVRLWTSSLKLAKKPALVLNGNENVNGKLVPISIVQPRVIHNPQNGGYITLTEGVGTNGKRSLIMQLLDSSLKNNKVFSMYPDARSGRLALDTKRNELYIVAQLQRSVFQKASMPKLAYGIIVKKRSLSGDLLPYGDFLLKAGETRLLDSSISCFYDVSRDRLMVFWSDMVGGRRVIRSSRILIKEGVLSAELLDGFQEEVCPGGNLRALSIAEFPTTIGQLVVGEQRTSKGFRLHGPLIKEEAFQFSARNQRSPLLVSNEAGDQILALWQEVINARQSNVYGRILKAGTYNCVKCNSPKVCKKQDTCVLPFKGDNPCSVNNGQCSHNCFKSITGAKCSCMNGFKLGNDKLTCVKHNDVRGDMTIVLASEQAIWKTTVMKDGSLNSVRLFRGESLVAVFFDKKTNLLYWSDVESSIIYTGLLDGTRKEIFMSNVKSDGIVIDSDAGKVFLTDFLSKSINVVDTNKKNKISLVTSEIDKPRAITLCKKHRVTYLYWSDWGSLSKIERLQLDHSLSSVTNRRIIVSHQLVWPNGLTADCDADRLYWADAKLDKIEVSDLLGNSRRKLDSITVLHPFSLLVHGNRLYWSDWAGILKKADKQTGLNSVEVINGISLRGFYILKGLASTCPDPAKPRKGNRNIQSNKVGGTVIYTCNPGYNLLGNKIRKCLQGGVWSGDSPTCMSLPVFTRTPQNKIIPKGNSAVFQCSAMGSGKIELKWLKDGQPLQATTRILVVGSRLIITEVVHSDEGTYTCQASNKAGMIKAVAYLKVDNQRRIECGLPKFQTRKRIFGGRNADEGAHPWVAMFWDELKRRPFCGGSLVTKKFVLTAAHCLESLSRGFNHVKIKFGKIKAKRRIEPNEQIRSISKVHSNPHYNERTYDSDIAIIELDTPVQLTDYVMPICLPHDESDLKLLAAKANAVVVGWGATRKTKYIWSKRLKEIVVKVINKTECKKKMPHVVTENMFCAGIGGFGDTCEGDSGGPIVMKNQKTKRHVLIGIVSWGLDCANPNYYGIYVKVYNFLRWVHTVIS